MEPLIFDFIPHDPRQGLFVTPDIPRKKLLNAIEDYASKVRADDVVALYDATRLGSAKDGAVFMADRFAFQNNNLEPAHEIHYRDLVRVESRKKFMGGQRLTLLVNRGRATIEVEMDFSARPDAAAYVSRFLEEALLRSTAIEMDEDPKMKRPSRRSGEASETDVRRVEETLIALVREGSLSEKDYREMMRALR